MASTSPRPLYRQRSFVFTGGAVVAGVAALAAGMWLGGNLVQIQINGLAIGGSNSFTGWGLPASKLVMELSSVGVVGMLLASLLLPAQGKELGAPARRCLRTAIWLALAWAVSNTALLVFSWSDVAAQPVSKIPIVKLFTDATNTFPDVADYISSIAMALVITVAIAITQTRWGAMLVLPLTLYNLVPMALQGHAGHGTVLKYSLIVHVIAISLWVGGLAALLLHARWDKEALAVAVPRFSNVALACYVAVVSSGVLAAWRLLLSWPALWGSRYGVLVMFKATALITLGIFGWWHRRHTVKRIRTGDGQRSRRAFVQLAAAEVVVMIAAVAIAVAMSRSASPDTINLHSGRGAGAASFEHVQPDIRHA